MHTEQRITRIFWTIPCISASAPARRRRRGVPHCDVDGRRPGHRVDVVDAEAWVELQQEAVHSLIGLRGDAQAFLDSHTIKSRPW